VIARKLENLLTLEYPPEKDAIGGGFLMDRLIAPWNNSRRFEREFARADSSETRVAGVKRWA